MSAPRSTNGSGPVAHEVNGFGSPRRRRSSNRAEEAGRYAEVETAAAELEADGVVAAYRDALARREAAEEAGHRRAYAGASLAAVEKRLASRRAEADERGREGS